MTTAVVHICAPQPDEAWKRRRQCPTCERRTTLVFFHTPWYGVDITCLRCGENWDGEEGRRERPFEPGWRPRSIAAARKRWRRFVA